MTILRHRDELFAPISSTSDYWEAMYLRAKEDNRALHKGIKRLKNKEKELLERIEYLEAYNKSLVLTAIQNAYPNRKVGGSIECKMNLHRVGGTD